MAGFDAAGNEKDSEDFLEDLKTVMKLERRLVVDPVEVAEQLQRFQNAHLDGASDAHDLQKISKFAELGGHVSLNTIEQLADVARKGYVMLLEYVFDEARVPGGYIYGFSPSFEQDSRYPTLGLNAIAADPDVVEALIKDKEQVITNWRTGVPVSFDDLAEDGFSVPEEIRGMSARRLSAGTALKYVVCDPEQKILMLNIGTIRSVDAVLGGSFLSNVASTEYNGEFLQCADWSRSHRDIVETRDEDGRPVGRVLWRIYWNEIRTAIRQLENPNGVLVGKAHWALERLQEFRSTIWAIQKHQRWKIHRLIAGMGS